MILSNCHLGQSGPAPSKQAGHGLPPQACMDELLRAGPMQASPGQVAEHELALTGAGSA